MSMLHPAPDGHLPEGRAHVDMCRAQRPATAGLRHRRAYERVILADARIQNRSTRRTQHIIALMRGPKIYLDLTSHQPQMSVLKQIELIGGIFHECPIMAYQQESTGEIGEQLLEDFD
jgi:hypothetical protein